MVLMLLRKSLSIATGKHVTGYKKLVIMTLIGNATLFYAHPCFQALVHFEEENQSGDSQERFYPSKVIGFIEVDRQKEAVIQCCLEPLEWSTVQAIFC